MRRSLLLICIVLLFLAEIARVYFIMPFPGSQQNNTIGLAYWLHQNIVWVRLVLLGAILALSFIVFRRYGKPARILTAFALIAYAILFYFFNYRFQADKMFYQPNALSMTGIESNRVAADKLVIGVELNGQAKAYPIQLIGYHHQVRDTIGNEPVMITYCTVCRTGRVYVPEVNGEPENFRLVGMDHFNAMFEDSHTGSWWQQATGKAIAGPLKGAALKEIPHRQASLESWMRLNPNSLIMQPDSSFAARYKDLEGFDKGTVESGLEKRDSGSWKFKSWVVGIEHAKTSRAYDWNELLREKIIEDSLPGLPILLLLENDSSTFHAWSRLPGDQPLHFRYDAATGQLRDIGTNSIWDMKGWCIEGPQKGMYLPPVQAYQEFWHSWETFHPQTTKYASRGEE